MSVTGDPSTGIATSHLFEKGYTATYAIESSSGGIRFRFSATSPGICDCLTTCSDEVNLGICPDDNIYLLDVGNSSLTGEESFRQSVFFIDALGNTGEVVARAIHMTTPAAPSLNHYNNQIDVEVSYLGENTGDLTGDAYQYQIQRYRGSESNIDYLADWSLAGDTGLPDVVADLNPVQGRVYGYRARVRTEQGSTSQWSDWATEHV